MVLEICVESVASAVAAELGGAQRIELCSNLFEGGTTPAAGLLSVVRRRVSIDVAVMIRPRGGDFLYSEDEFEVMQADVEQAQGLGADAIVLGMLNADGYVDVERTRRLVELARPLPVTFHRAIDMSADLMACLEQVIEAGAQRVLTSGGAQSALEGSGRIRELLAASAGRIAIMAGSGITEANAREIAQATGVREFHASLRRSVPSGMRYSVPDLALGDLGSREYTHSVTLEEDVRRLATALDPLAAFPSRKQ